MANLKEPEQMNDTALWVASCIHIKEVMYYLDKVADWDEPGIERPEIGLIYYKMYRNEDVDWNKYKLGEHKDIILRSYDYVDKLWKELHKRGIYDERGNWVTLEIGNRVRYGSIHND